MVGLLGRQPHLPRIPLYSGFFVAKSNINLLISIPSTQKKYIFVDSHGIIENSLHQFSSKFHFFSIHSLITRKQDLRRVLYTFAEKVYKNYNLVKTFSTHLASRHRREQSERGSFTIETTINNNKYV